MQVYRRGVSRAVWFDGCFRLRLLRMRAFPTFRDHGFFLVFFWPLRVRNVLFPFSSASLRQQQQQHSAGGFIAHDAMIGTSASPVHGVNQGIITGRKPYRMLDEVSEAHGATRLRALALLPLFFFLMGALVISYEVTGSNIEDRDTRDMTWDYRVTLAASTAFHSYFRQAYWSAYRTMNDADDVYREVVLAAEDRPVVLALSGANCDLTVTVPCLATKPEHRSSAAGPLNLGTDNGTWAVGNGRAFKRNATFSGLLDDGVSSVPLKYPDATSLASAFTTGGTRGFAELTEMRRVVGVPGDAVAAGLSCAADVTGKTCSWTAAQWSTWATNAHTALQTATCNTEVEVCSQVSAALEAAAKSVVANSDGSNKVVAVRVVSGSWAKDNLHLTALASVLPVVTVVSNKANDGSDALDRNTETALNWYYLTDPASTTGADNTSYVPPAAAVSLVNAAAATASIKASTTTASTTVKAGYLPPGDADTAYYGLRGGVIVNGVRANLESTFETSEAWNTHRSFEKLFVEFWPWPAKCSDVSHNVTVASDDVTVTNFPAFIGDSSVDDVMATVAVTVLGTTRNVPAYRSSCDFDGAAAGAASSAVSCAWVRALSSLRVDVAFTPTAGDAFGAWRVVNIEPGYGGGNVAALDTFSGGTEAGAVSFFGGNTTRTRTLRVTMRDAGAPEVFTAPELGTGGKIYATMALCFAGVLAMPTYPYLMMKVKFNVAVNEGRPPPGWKEMVRYRGW